MIFAAGYKKRNEPVSPMAGLEGKKRTTDDCRDDG